MKFLVKNIFYPINYKNVDLLFNPAKYKNAIKAQQNKSLGVTLV